MHFIQINTTALKLYEIKQVIDLDIDTIISSWHQFKSVISNSLRVKQMYGKLQNLEEMIHSSYFLVSLCYMYG